MKYIIIIIAAMIFTISCKNAARECATDCENKLRTCAAGDPNIPTGTPDAVRANLKWCEEQASLCLEFCRTKYR